ncbi:MAG: GNAT family N-acetyltransferase [Gammaproteobacteria bacterium]|nr:GNAT family N-acetyltransferase [Gammaproteobacteria bacterium]
MSIFQLTAELPEGAEYVRLRAAAGLSNRSVEAARIGLPRSLFAVCIREQEELIAMGRIVGDGGCNFEIVDIAVHPAHQRKGLGYRIMAALMEYLHNNAPTSAYVSLIADGGAPALYEKFGFKPTAPESVGMALIL